MRIQFLVAAHKEPALLRRLCERLSETPDAAITVQWDCATPSPSMPSGLEVDLRPTRAPCEWGSAAQLDAMLDSLRSLAADPFDWLVLLSGQDYPIRPLSELADFLAATPHQLFLRPEEMPVHEVAGSEPASSYLYDRYFYRYRWLPQRWWAMLTPHGRRVVGASLQRGVGLLSPRRALRVQRRPENEFSPGIGHRVRAHPFTADRPCRKGSDWFVISRAVFDDLLGAMESAPELVEYYRHCYCPNESFFHTVLLSEWEQQNAGDNLHYFKFVGSGAHPDTLRDGDWEILRRSGAFFARKFDASSTSLLDRIDREVLTSERFPRAR